MPRMKLYLSPISPNSRKVSAVQAHLGLECDVQIVDLSNEDNRAPRYLAVNPNGMVPTMIDDGFTLWESNAIMAYMCSKVDTELWPDGNARYDVLRWMNWELAHWGRWLTIYGFEMFRDKFGMGEVDEKALAAAGAAIARFGKVLDDHLSRRTFLVGDALTIADFAVASHLAYRIPAKYPLDSFKHILAWEARLAEVPAWRDTTPES